MPGRKIEQRNIRKLTRIGKWSFAVTIPVERVREWGWKEKQKLILEIDEKRRTIKIRDWKKK